MPASTWTADSAGDAGGFMNSMRLKGIHLAMRTGMLAAETAFEAVRAGDVSASKLSAYKTRIDASPVRRELYPVRNVHQAFGHGLFAGLIYSGISLVTGGWWFRDPMPSHAGHERIAKMADYYNGTPPSPDQPVDPVKIDRELTFDRATNVHFSGTRHLEDQPSHLIVHDTDICRTRCRGDAGIRARGSVPRPVRNGGRRRRRRNCTSTRPTACTARRCDIMDPCPDHRLGATKAGKGPKRRPVTPRFLRGASSRRPRSPRLVFPLLKRSGATYAWRETGRSIFSGFMPRSSADSCAVARTNSAATLYFRDRGVVAMTSENFDGEWVAQLMRRFVATPPALDVREAARSRSCDGR